MQKSAARKIFKEKRQSFPTSDISKMDDLLLINFQSLEWPFIDCLFSFWPIEENNEPNTHLFTEFLRFRNPELEVLYPKSDFEKKVMHAVATDADTPFEKHEYNIYEPHSDQVISPQKIDMVFVPMIVCDQQGARVGYGKGFYDRYLKKCRKDCIKIGFSYFEPIDKVDDANEFDVPLDLCVTPQNVYVF
ncbi:MAG TPA: 5-formyltetrahydrofolate cyclo-ligase [Chitinophagaceae bacterium]|jgi:5,10-methenyltetrahydrofolate synthetase